VTEDRVILEDESDPPSLGSQVSHVNPVEFDSARVRWDQTRDHAQDRAFAASTAAQQHEEFALLNLKRDVAHHQLAAVMLGEIGERDRHQA
jgi:hypothetical protein